MCQICINGTFRTECLPNKNAKLYWNQEEKGRGKKKKQEREKKKEKHPHSSQSRSPHGQGERLVWVQSSLLVLAHWRQRGKELRVSRGMFHEWMKGGKSIESLVGLLKAWHKNISSYHCHHAHWYHLSSPGGFSSHHETAQTTHATPILSPTVKSCSSLPQKSIGGKCKIILLMSNRTGQTSNTKSHQKIKIMS